MADGMTYTIALLGSYILGSIPFGLLLASVAGHGDIRSIGSGSIGATNVLRTGNKTVALLTLLCDILKGAVAVLAVRIIWPDAALLPAAAALAAVIGHLFPIWLKFRGGKGVATAGGALLALAWPIGVISAAIWFLVAALFRYSSLAGLVAVASTPLLALYFLDETQAMFLAAIAALVWLRHHANIRRLLKGEEPKIGNKPDAEQ
jgi:acyl phosphate:glycerol-3-phosphate acyltransferase